MNQQPFCSEPRRITQEKHVNLFTTEICTPKGRIPWTFASRKQQPGGVAGQADAVVVIATLRRDGEACLVMTREFRAPLVAYELSLPSGLIDPGESPADAARREFREETGLVLSRVLLVSPPLASSAGLTDETVSLVYGEATGEVSGEHQTEHEDIEVRLMGIADIRRVLEQPGGEIISSRVYPMLVGYVMSGAILLPSLTSQ